jgi:VanZ family protein
LWLGVIRAESTDTASASNTGALLYRMMSSLVPHVQPWFVDEMNAVLRKTGHFLGYAILSALVLLALRNTNRDRLHPLLRRAWGTCLHDHWRREWAWLGILLTLVTASFDELHQSFIPSRTGRWQDVVLDTGGAIAIQIFIYARFAYAIRKQESRSRRDETVLAR